MTQPPYGEPAGTSSAVAAEAPEPDHLDAAPPAELPEWPPVGAYPGEPGHPAADPLSPDAYATAAADQAAPGWPPAPTDPALTADATQPIWAAEPADATQPLWAAEPADAAEPDRTVGQDGPSWATGPTHEAEIIEPVMADEQPFHPVAGDTEIVEGVPVWHQPPPSGPFHARHEKPGEWRTEPPEHLALEHSPPAEVQPGVQHDLPTEAIPLSMLPHPWEVPFDPHATETEVLRPPPKHKRPFWVAVAVVLTLLIFGGGTLSAYLLLRDAESGKGAPDPATAVNQFMTAVYTRQDPATAGETVCREARDEEQLKARIDQIRGYANEYDAPSFRWNDPAVSGQTDQRATVGVQLTLTTDDEKTAQQQLTFTVVRKTGWLVCDVTG